MLRCSSSTVKAICASQLQIEHKSLNCSDGLPQPASTRALFLRALDAIQMLKTFLPIYGGSGAQAQNLKLPGNEMLKKASPLKLSCSSEFSYSKFLCSSQQQQVSRSSRFSAPRISKSLQPFAPAEVNHFALLTCSKHEWVIKTMRCLPH